nr:hypothetical protein [Tanacetum cinerariifolium]
SPDYIHGPEDPEQAPPSPDYVPGPEHADDEIVVEDQPYAQDASPTAQSPEYVLESDLEAHPEDDDDEDPEEDPEEEEEHPALADSVVVALTAVDQAPSAEETETFESDESAATPSPHPAYRMTARISIPAPVPVPAWSDSVVVRLLAMSSPPSSLLSPWSSPPPQIPFPPLPPILSPPSPVLSPAPPPSPIHVPSSGTPLLLPISAPTSSPPLQLPSASHREDRPEVTLPPRKRLETNGTKMNYQHVMLSEVQMAMIAIILERVLEGQNELLVNVLTLTFSSVNHYISKAPKELPVFPNGLKEWSMSFISELALLCGRMFSEESDKNEKYIGGLPDMIHESVVASKPKTMQEAVEIATELMDKKIHTFAERETATSGEKKQYGGSKPLCAKCNYHHDGPCAPKCHKCNKVGHFARDYRNTANTNNANNQMGAGLGRKPTCYECGDQGYFKRECPKLKNNNNHGNQGGRNNAPARVYAVGRAGTDLDANVVTGTFLLNNRYASVLFDTGANKSFESTAFSTQINITPSTLDHYYDVELADGRIIRLNTILRGCTLNFINHQFNINLIPVELDSFDAIIDLDWLAKFQAVIASAEKIVRIPWGNETLIIHGDGSSQGNATRLNIISCTKTKKYMMKGFLIFLAHITTNEVEDKSEKKRLEDVPIVQNFPEVFLEDLPGLLLTRPVEFQIDLVPGAAPVA